MKLYIKGLMLAGVLGATACTDLDTDIDARYVDFPDNPIAVEGEFNGCYKFLHGWMGRDFGEGVIYQGDEVMGCNYGVGNYYDDGRYLDASIHSLHLDNWRTKAGMEGAMNGLTYTNQRIAMYGGPNFNDPVVAPLRAIRAYYHFWMMDIYGDFPILDHVLDADEQVPQRAKRADLCRWIEKELLEILAQTNANGEPALSQANDVTTYGKPNYWMAAALLAKVYLNWGVYTNDIKLVDNNTPNEKLNDCIHWCDEIIKSGLFEVGSGYRKKFFPDNGVHIKDFIYALDVDPNGKGDGTTTWHRWFACKKETYLKPYMFKWKNPKSVAGNAVLTKEAVARFNLPGDERNIMILQGPQYAFDPITFEPTNEPLIMYADANLKTKLFQLEYIVDFDFDDARIYSLGDESLPKATKENLANGTVYENIRKGARLMKYPPREEDYVTWDRQQANDAPIFRLADILLTKAECILRGGTATLGDSFESLLNQVRDCAGAPHVNVATEGANPASGLTPQQQVLLDERSRELILEPWRRNDLIRFGQFEADWGQKNSYKEWDDASHTTFHWVDRAGVKDPTRRLMPLHRDILNTNLHWKQNDGYAGV